MADGDETMEDASVMVEGKASSTAATASAAVSASGGAGSGAAGGKMFTLKKWNGVAMWSWDVECDTCAICRVQVMDACLRCQAENKHDDCVVVWGDCNHSFHNCCMSLWVKQNNRCPLCQQEWVVQRIGK